MQIRKYSTAPYGSDGFTLLELAIVLVIISLITAMAVTSGISVVANSRQSATIKKMKAIDDALLAFRVANDRIPCPADLTIVQGNTNWGMEAGSGTSTTIGTGTGVCTGSGMNPQANFTGTGVTSTWATAAEGAVPVVTLGLPADFMVDGWGNRIRYSVDTYMTTSGAFPTEDLGCQNGPITVLDGNGNKRSSTAIYALISHGANGHGAYSNNGLTISSGSSSANELINCHCDSTGATTTSSGVQSNNPATYVQTAPAYDTGQVGNTAYYFDDLVTYKERWQMRTDWDKSGPNCPAIYISDNGNHRVVELTLNGNYVLSIGSGYQNAGGSVGASGTGNGQFQGPADVRTDAQGYLYANDYGRVEKFSSVGAYLSTPLAPTYGTGYNQNNNSDHIAIDLSGNIWLLSASKFEEYTNGGTYLRTVGGDKGDGTHTCTQCTSPTSCACYSGTGVGQFSALGNISIDASNNVYFDDPGSNNDRVQEYTSSGQFVQIIAGDAGDGTHTCTQCTSQSACTCYADSSAVGNGKVINPAVAVDTSGNVWIVDTWGILEKFNNSGTFLSQFPIAAGGGAADIYIDSNNNIWIPDSTNNRVLEYSTSGALKKTISGSYGGRTINNPLSVGVYSSR